MTIEKNDERPAGVLLIPKPEALTGLQSWSRKLHPVLIFSVYDTGPLTNFTNTEDHAHQSPKLSGKLDDGFRSLRRVEPL